MVLEARGLAAFLCGDTGTERVAAALEGRATISAYSALELGRLLSHVPARELALTLRRLEIEIAPLDGALALEIAALPAWEAERHAARALARTRGLGVLEWTP